MINYVDGFNFGIGFVGAVLVYIIISGILGAMYKAFFGPAAEWKIPDEEEKD